MTEVGLRCAVEDREQVERLLQRGGRKERNSVVSSVGGICCGWDTTEVGRSKGSDASKDS